MLRVDRKDDGTHLILKFSGTLDETVDLTAAAGSISRKKIHLNLKEVTRINSIGVKGWLKWLHLLQNQGAEVKFLDCSPAFVGQLNLILSFSAGYQVESLMVPFRCSSCRTELAGSFRTGDLKLISYVLPNLKCPKCSAEAIFDDDAQEYFAFALRSPA